MNEVLVARAIGRVAAAHPKLHIDCRLLHPAEVLRQVLAGQADLGVGNIFRLDREARIAVEPLPSRRVYLACRPGHPLTRIADPTLAQALRFALVTTRLRGEQAALAASQGQAGCSADAPDDYVPPVLVNSVALARVIAQESDLLVPATAAMLADDIASGRLVRLTCAAPAMRTTDGMQYLRDRSLSPAARTFIATLRQVEAESQAAALPVEVPA